MTNHTDTHTDTPSIPAVSIHADTPFIPSILGVNSGVGHGDAHTDTSNNTSSTRSNRSLGMSSYTSSMEGLTIPMSMPA